MFHLVGCLYYLYQWCTVKQISNNEIYFLIKYIKSVLSRLAKCLSYIEEARCLKVKVMPSYLLTITTAQPQIYKLIVWPAYYYRFRDRWKRKLYCSSRVLIEISEGRKFRRAKRTCCVTTQQCTVHSRYQSTTYYITN